MSRLLDVASALTAAVVALITTCGVVIISTAASADEHVQPRYRSYCFIGCAEVGACSSYPTAECEADPVDCGACEIQGDSGSPTGESCACTV